MNSPGGRGRKKKGSAYTSPSPSTAPEGDAPDQVSPHKRNLFYFSYPLLAVFALFRIIALYSGILFAWVCERLSRAMAARAKQPEDVCSAEYEDSGELIRNHHKQAFEYISVALRIDEDDKGWKKIEGQPWVPLLCQQPERQLTLSLSFSLLSF